LSRLLLVRHGNTMLDSGLRFWGKTDVKLSDDGIKQAKQLRDRLVKEEINAIYSSNLSRALVTAKIIAAPHRLTPIACDELAEINFGILEGLTFDEISQLHPEQARAMTGKSIPPRFPGGESITEINDRVKKFLPCLLPYSAEETVLIVAHSGTLRLLLCNLLGLDLHHWRQLRINLASLSIVANNPQSVTLELLNDVSHLSS